MSDISAVPSLPVIAVEHVYKSVTDSTGRVIYRHRDSPGQRRVGDNVANSVLKAMLPIAGWSNGKILSGGRPSAVKTGTVQLGDTGHNKDAWWIGATPQLATAVWVGTENNTPLTNSWGGSMYGAGLPGTIWQKAMNAALQDEKVLAFPEARQLGYTSPKIVLNYGGSGWYGGPGAGTGTGTATVPNTPADPAAGGDGAGDTDQGPEPAPAPAPAPPEQIEILPGVNVPNIFGL